MTRKKTKIEVTGVQMGPIMDSKGNTVHGLDWDTLNEYVRQNPDLIDTHTIPEIVVMMRR